MVARIFVLGQVSPWMVHHVGDSSVGSVVVEALVRGTFPSIALITSLGYWRKRHRVDFVSKWSGAYADGRVEVLKLRKEVR